MQIDMPMTLEVGNKHKTVSVFRFSFISECVTGLSSQCVGPAGRRVLKCGRRLGTMFEIWTAYDRNKKKKRKKKKKR